MKLSKQIVWVFIVISLVLGIVFLALNRQIFWDEQVPEVVIAVSKTPLSAPIYVAHEKSLFDPSCVKVKLKDVFGGNRSFETVVSGDADFGTSSDSVIVFKSALRNDFVNLGTFVQSDNDVKLVTLEESGVRESIDLSGKKVGVTKGAAGEYFLSTYLAIGGVEIEQIERVYLQPEKLRQALIDNDVDVIVPWEPFAYRTIKQLKGNAKVLQTKNLYTLTFNLLASKTQLASKLPAARCVLEGIQSGINYIASHDGEAQKIIMQRLSLDQGFIDWVWKDYVFKLSLNHSLLMNLQSQANWAIEYGLIEPQQIPDFEQILYTDLLKDIDPLAVNL